VSSHATILALACALGAAGCSATFTPEPLVTYYAGGTLGPVAEVPPDIWAYPRVYYEGSWAYLVNGSWYVPTQRGWMTYREEPRELSRQRTRIYAAPRAAPLPRTPVPAYPREYPQPYRPTEPYEYGRERTPSPR
jgi:hypothetical protein